MLTITKGIFTAHVHQASFRRHKGTANEKETLSLHMALPFIQIYSSHSAKQKQKPLHHPDIISFSNTQVLGIPHSQ